MDDHGTFKLQAQRIQGPILVLGASGFVGANLFRALLRQRNDVYGTTSPPSAWRLSGLAEASVVTTDLLVDQNLINLLDRIKPKTVFAASRMAPIHSNKTSTLSTGPTSLLRSASLNT